jgi:hypothetical protein
MGAIRGGRGWVVPRGGLDFLGPPLQKFSEPLSRSFKYINEFLNSWIVYWHPLWGNQAKWGVCGQAHKSEANAHWVQAAGWVKPKEQRFTPNFQDSVSIRYLVEIWRNKAIWGCVSQLWVLGRSCVHGRPYLSFCPITLYHFNCKSG